MKYKNHSLKLLIISLPMIMQFCNLCHYEICIFTEIRSYDNTFCIYWELRNTQLINLKPRLIHVTYVSKANWNRFILYVIPRKLKGFRKYSNAYNAYKMLIFLVCMITFILMLTFLCIFHVQVKKYYLRQKYLQYNHTI